MEDILLRRRLVEAHFTDCTDLALAHGCLVLSCSLFGYEDMTGR